MIGKEQPCNSTKVDPPMFGFRVSEPRVATGAEEKPFGTFGGPGSPLVGLNSHWSKRSTLISLIEIEEPWH